MKFDEYRCTNPACGGKLLLKASAKEAVLKVKCPRCNRLNVFYIDKGGRVKVELKPEGIV